MRGAFVGLKDVHTYQPPKLLESSLGESLFNRQISRTGMSKGQPTTIQHQLDRGPFHIFKEAYLE